jgi:hypothetical protein
MVSRSEAVVRFETVLAVKDRAAGALLLTAVQWFERQCRGFEHGLTTARKILHPAEAGFRMTSRFLVDDVPISGSG